jgi:hypothetical protein
MNCRFKTLVVASSMLVASRALADGTTDDSAIISRPPPIAAAELAPYAGKGTSSITGRLFAALPGDHLRAFVSVPVYALPVIPYTFWYERFAEVSWVQGRTRPAIRGDDAETKQLFRYRRLAISDASGIFKLTDLRPGKWLVYAQLSVRDGRTYTSASTSESYGMGFVGNQRDESGGFTPQFAPMSTSHTDYSTQRYTCETTGVLSGEADVAADKSVSIPMGLLGQQNNGC